MVDLSKLSEQELQDLQMQIENEIEVKIKSKKTKAIDAACEALKKLDDVLHSPYTALRAEDFYSNYNKMLEATTAALKNLLILLNYYQ